jgi:amidohydrolase
MKITDLVQESGSLFGEMQSIRRHLHMHPELSFKEFETSAFVAATLKEVGLEPVIMAETGVVAHIGQGDTCVALRADIDALPIVEETGLDYASVHPGVMHACGHDTHTTMLLTAARILKAHEEELGGVVKLIFQPGEEKSPGGASIMIREGVLDAPRPRMIFGQHIDPGAPFGTLSFVAGPMMAAADELYFTIRGFGGHAAQPHKGRDPIFAATGLVHHLQHLITKRRNPIHAGVMTITAIEGGSATNIIPDVVTMKGTLRAFDQQWREEAWAFLEEQTRQYCALHQCEGSVEIVKGYPPLVNHADAVDLARGVAVDLIGEDRVATFEPKMWAEDFSFYGEQIPSCFWMLGGKPADVEGEMPGLHNPRFAPEEQAMVTGAAMMAAVAIKALQ